ncbi:hypothetical protein GOBAR_AA22942 [Gossypium barbadense]|uniref:O-methyltransferase domain-containing protein n=1 Tax=Gossypium barbadense TaxID=3634 RepID=A0A2P5X318_GOSBA|nr:hypothetical protein GOBAR_AA22942 [Gossypium barbadense]
MEFSAENHNKDREHDEESFSYAAQIVNSYVLPMSMNAAIQLDVFEIMAKAGPDAKLSPNEIVAQLPTKNPEAPSMLDRLLRGAWNARIRIPREGPEVQPCFQHRNDEPHHFGKLVMNNILDAYKGFVQHLNQVIVDIGGGLGVSLRFITSKYPSIKGINFDLPHVIQHAPPIPGVEHVAGDMFQNVPKGDAIFMKFILHDWSDDDCLKLLKNCYKAIPDEGKIVVVDCMLPDVPNTSSGGERNEPNKN